MPVLGDRDHGSLGILSSSLWNHTLGGRGDSHHGQSEAVEITSVLLMEEEVKRPWHSLTAQHQGGQEGPASTSLGASGDYQVQKQGAEPHVKHRMVSYNLSSASACMYT